MSEPLARVTSLKVKLGLLVAVSVAVAAVLATAGAGSVTPWLGIPVTVLIALAVTQLLASGMTAPLRQMTAAARRMATGDYAVRVDTTSSDEVGELARAFNRMAAELATVDQQRRDLVATVSHELRTPLAGLVAVLDNLADGVVRPDPGTIRTALQQAERLGALVEDLLDLSRVDAGVVPLDRRAVDVDRLVRDAVEEAGTLPRGVTYDEDVPAGLRIEGDPRRLHQLLANLLDNAARHSPADGSVRVAAGTEREAGIVWLEVADAGPGIAPGDRERVFERYGTADTAAGGTGLGLAIARWVAELHGGRVRALDPSPGTAGARLRVELPTSRAPRERIRERTTVMPASPPAGPAVGAPHSAPVPARPMPAPESTVDVLFGGLWRDPGTGGLPWALVACAAVGVLTGATLPFEPLGLATSVVLLASGGIVLAAARRRTSFTWACAVLCVCLAVVPTVRAAEWLAVLCLLTGAGLVAVAVVDARSVVGMALAAVSWPLAGLRGLPWLGRSLRRLRGSGEDRATATVVLRTVLLGVVLVLVFGTLVATGDAIVGQWVSGVVPDVGAQPILRVFLAVATTGIVLAAVYLALNPPVVERDRVRRPVLHRFEWLAPVLLVDAVLALFMAAQAAAFFGGHDYVRRTTGLTYADYVHQGFAQLTLVTLLVLAVVAVAARKAGLEAAADRWWLRVSLGLLCLLTLVVVGSALHRMGLYQQAYGFTRLRLLVDLFEGWLGLVVVGVLVGGTRLRATWLPRAAVLGGATLLVLLAIVNPDAWIAQHNLDRYHATGKVDWDYLSGLGADAVPTVLELPRAEAACALPGHIVDGSWTRWNLGRDRALREIRQAGLLHGPRCSLTSTP